MKVDRPHPDLRHLWLAKITICRRMKKMNGFFRFGQSPCKTGLMLRLLRLLPALATRFFRSRRNVLLENLALGQQLAVLKRRHRQPRFGPSEKLFWAILRRLWFGWRQTLILVQPGTVV
jgi:hypothetical protein